MKEYYVWGIRATDTDIDGTVRKGLLGVYYFDERPLGDPPPITTRLFRTREEARSKLRLQKLCHAWAFDKNHTAAVVKVRARFEIVD